MLVRLNILKAKIINLKFARQFVALRKLDMDQAYFKYNAEEEKLNISLRFQKQIDENRVLDKNFNFSRNLKDKVSTTLDRIKANVEKELKSKIHKKNKKKPQQEDPTAAQSEVSSEVSVRLYQNNDDVAGKTFEDLLPSFENDDNFRLMIEEQIYKVNYNSPWINKILLPVSILAGFYVYPTKLDLDFASRHSSEFIWYRGQLPASKREDQIEWEQIGNGFSFMTRSSDIGFRIRLRAIPKSVDGKKIGPEVEAISKNEVEASPGVCPFDYRHLFTEQKLSGNALRVVSYNILADYYADTEDGRKKLFAYCAQYAIDIDYRRQLLVKEIVGYNADILCMQEVDHKVFDSDLVPFLSELQSMSGVHVKKGTTPEGLATFFRADRFELLENHGLNIGETVKTHPACQNLFQKLQYNEQLVQRLTDRSTTLQVVLLKSKEHPEKFILVANTHLYFHPDADHIRLLQIGFSMILVEDFMKNFKENYSTNDLSLLFCGDFNSVPECGIYKLLTEGHVPNSFIDWSSKQEEAVKEVELIQPFNMQSACGILKFTNYTMGFKEPIDWIFYQTEKFNVTKVVEIPSEEDLSAHIAIPSVVFPSDHIAIIAELEIKN